MGRRRRGPYQLKKGETWYARLVVPAAHRDKAGKTALIRSLKTTNHSEALKRYGKVMEQLEAELQVLLGVSTLRQKVESHREGIVRTGDASLTPAELTAITLGSFNPDDQTHQAVYQSFDSGQPLPITWEEALDVWQREANRKRQEPVAKSTIYKYKQAIKFFSPYGHPHQNTKKIIRQFLEDHEEDYVETTVAARFRYLSAIFQTLVETDKVSISNPFREVSYTAAVPISRQRRAYTDDEIRLIHKKHPKVFLLLMTGLRAGEFFSRLPQDLNGQILKVDKQPTKDDWRPKTASSYRTVAVPPSFSLTLNDYKVQTNITRIGIALRQDIKDPTAPVHSARHTFITIARRADCSDSIVTALTGHAVKGTSRIAQQYGLFPDDVLLREAQKVWNYIHNNILKNDPISTRSD